jgi:1,4-dihydroxy-2-naphthoyl-CoA hydrolase
MRDVLGVDPRAAGAWVVGTGLVFDDIADKSVSGHVELGPEHLTPWGVVHGGLYATVAESAATVGASVAVRERGQFAVGVDNLTDFLRPMTSGRLSVTAAPIIQGQSEQLWEVTMSRSDGKTVARSRVRLRNVDLPPVEATKPAGVME